MNEDRVPSTKEASMLARKIRLEFGQTWKFCGKRQREEVAEKVEIRYREARREWKKAMSMKTERKQEKKSNKKDQDVIDDIMNEKQGKTQR